MPRPLLRALVPLGIAFASMSLPALAQKPKPAPSAAKISREQAMLVKLMLRYRSAETLSHNVKGIISVTVDGVVIKGDLTLTVRMAQLNKFAIQTAITFFGKTSKGSAYSDGITVWDVNDDTKEYTEQPIDALIKNEDAFTDWLLARLSMEMAAALFLQTSNKALFGIPEGVDQSIEVKNYPVKEVDGIPLYVIPIAVDKKQAKGTGGTVSLYADTKDLLVRRSRFALKTPGEKKQTVNVDMVMFYSDVKAGEKLPDDTFAFKPADTMKKVTSVKPVFDRAFNE